LEQGDYDRAIDNYSHAIALDPKRGLDVDGARQRHTKKGNLDAAIADYGEAIKLDASRPRPGTALLARVHQGARTRPSLDLALADCDKAAASRPTMQRSSTAARWPT